MKREKLHNKLLETLGLALSFIVLVPVYFVIVNSLKTKNDASDMLLSFPTTFNVIENYSTVLKEGNILSAFKNSLIITLTSDILIVLVSSMAAFVLQRRAGKFSKMFDIVIIAGMIVPPSIVPLFWILKLFHLQSSILGVILIYIALGFSFSTFLYKGFYGTVPRELDEAAIIDGCSGVRMFFNIILPLLKPVTVTVFITQFMAVWNDFTIVLYFLSSPKRFTMPLTVYFFFGQFSSYWNLVFADVIIIALPVILVYIFAQKYIIAGMTAGSVKG